jgi:hypothetical protein
VCKGKKKEQKKVHRDSSASCQVAFSQKSAEKKKQTEKGKKARRDAPAWCQAAFPPRKESP